jgi:acetolactate decarboxylase
MKRAVVAAVLLVACKSTPPPAVSTYGSVNAVRQGKIGPTVTIAALGPANEVVAVGAMSELRGEITIVDSKVWLAYAREDGTTRVQSPTTSDEKVAFLVSARIPKWQTSTLAKEILFTELDAAIEKLAEAAGLDVEQPFPFVVDGTVANLRFHIVDGTKLESGSSHAEASLSRTLLVAKATLVGFYSKGHEGIFTNPGTRTHVHVVVPEGTVTGHVDDVAIRSGSTLRLPDTK